MEFVVYRGFLGLGFIDVPSMKSLFSVIVTWEFLKITGAPVWGPRIRSILGSFFYGNYHLPFRSPYILSEKATQFNGKICHSSKYLDQSEAKGKKASCRAKDETLNLKP